MAPLGISVNALAIALTTPLTQLGLLVAEATPVVAPFSLVLDVPLREARLVMVAVLVSMGLKAGFEEWMMCPARLAVKNCLFCLAVMWLPLI